MYVEKAYSTVDRSVDGDVKPGSPLGAFREEQAMSQHRVSPSLFLSSSSHTTQTATHTVTLTSTSYSTLYRYSKSGFFGVNFFIFSP